MICYMYGNLRYVQHRIIFIFSKWQVSRCWVCTITFKVKDTILPKWVLSNGRWNRGREREIVFVLKKKNGLFSFWGMCGFSTDYTNFACFGATCCNIETRKLFWRPQSNFLFENIILHHMRIYLTLYIYIYVCVCVCVFKVYVICRTKITNSRNGANVYT